MAEAPEENVKSGYYFQEIQVTGESRTHHMGVSPIGTLPGHRMHYVGHTDERNGEGRLLKIHTKDIQTGLCRHHGLSVL